VDICGNVETIQELNGFFVNIEQTRKGRYILSMTDISLEKYVGIHMENICGYHEGIDQIYINLLDGGVVRVDKQ
jgi:hypothetical protein